MSVSEQYDTCLTNVNHALELVHMKNVERALTKLTFSCLCLHGHRLYVLGNSLYNSFSEKQHDLSCANTPRQRKNIIVC